LTGDPSQFFYSCLLLSLHFHTIFFPLLLWNLCSTDDHLFSVTAVLQHAGTQEGTQVGGAAQEVLLTENKHAGTGLPHCTCWHTGVQLI